MIKPEAPRRLAGAERTRNLERLLALGSLVLYVFLVFDRLTVFPPYFFCDEAAGGVDARSILESGRDVLGERLPVMFRGLGDFALSSSVYAEVPAVFAFGLSEFSVRLTTAAWSLFGVACAYLLLRCPFRADTAWMTFALFAVTPVWFLHSRTGFEYVPAASSLLAFTLFYTLAFTRSAGYAIPAAVAAAATFYCYTAARGWIVVGLAVLALVNLREHVRGWRTAALGVGVLALCMAPYLWASWQHPEAPLKRLYALNFGEFRSKPPSEQFRVIAKNYAAALSPAFWFTWEGTQHEGPMSRHVVPQLAQLPQWTAPFALLGLVATLIGVRRFENRTLLALFAAAPFAASLVGFNNARGLAVGVFLLLFSLRGAEVTLRALGRLRLQAVATIIAAAALAGYALWFRNHVFEVAPRLYVDYGFYGLQIGAPQVFRWIQENEGRFPLFRVSHGAFNAGDVFIRFFLGREATAKTAVFDLSHLCRIPAVDPGEAVYIAPSTVLSELEQNGCPLRKELIDVVRDPTGTPVIEMARLTRGSDFTQWLAELEAKRREILTSTARAYGVSLRVDHPRLDMGDVQALVDGNPFSLARSAGINPANFSFHLPASSLRQVSVLLANTGEAEVRVTTESLGGRVEWGRARFSSAKGDDPLLRFRQPIPSGGVTLLEIQVRLLDADQYGFVHLAEISWE